MTNPAHTDKEKIVFPSKSEVKSADNFKTAYVFYKYDNIRKLYTFISPAIENLTGYTIDELNKIGFENIIRDTIVDGTNCYPVDKKSLRKIKECFATHLIETKNGKLKWIEDNSFAYLDSSEQSTLITGTLQDVSASMKGEKVKQIVLEILEEANSEKNINELFGFIHSSISKLMKADNFYIAYYHKDSELLTFPYFVDEVDKDSSSKKFGKGLTEYIIRTGKSALVDPEMDKELIKRGEVELTGPQSQIWLGVPLKIKEKTIGAMVVQDYKHPRTYGEIDKQLFDVIAYPISRAIERKIVEKEKEVMIKQLKDLNRSKDQLFSLISHDLKSPFNSLLGFANILTDEYDTLTQLEIKEYLNVINESSKTLFGMTTNLLHYSSLQLGKYEFRPRLQDLSAEVDSVLINLKDIINKKDILFKNEIEPHTFAFVDRDMLNLIFTNLITNSIKYSDTGGMIKVSTQIINMENEGIDNVRIAICDEGIGISDENLKKINDNEKFSTLGTYKELGTGLGLLLVKESLAVNNGSLQINSETGQGTVIFITLPASKK
ncbi:MAG: GAF domain-containing protein [Ignavibacteria bacterium]|nr:GAF domain-containing protein [Ignavibacteria bacterium]